MELAGLCTGLPKRPGSTGIPVRSRRSATDPSRSDLNAGKPEDDLPLGILKASWLPESINLELGVRTPLHHSGIAVILSRTVSMDFAKLHTVLASCLR
jgi:hypothetical protein